MTAVHMVKKEKQYFLGDVIEDVVWLKEKERKREIRYRLCH